MQSLKLVLIAMLATAAAPAYCATPDAPAVPAHIGRHVSTPQDEREIRQVIADFQTALKTKNILLLSSLMLHADIPFQTPLSPETIRKVRAERDPNENGLRGGGFRDFARFIRESKVPVEERFYNVKITQDGHIAWVMFDYEFVEDGKVYNYGVESWQMMKNVDGKWKIADVWWTMHLMP